MTCSSTPLEVFEQEDDISSGWYLHRFGDGKKMVIVLKPVTHLGRSICNSAIVSPKHVSFCLSDNENWVIRDLRSKHGTYVNDERVPEEGLALEEWDVICLGRVRPRNAHEYGFMLKHKQLVSSTSQSRTSSTDANDSFRSCSPVRSVQSSDQKSKSEISASSLDSCRKATLVTENLSPEKTKFNEQEQYSNKSVDCSSTSVIEISDGTSESDSKDSETTVKNPCLQERPSHELPILQQESISVSEKVGKWFESTGPENSPSGSRTITGPPPHKTKRRKESHLDDLDQVVYGRRTTARPLNYALDSDSLSSKSEGKSSDKSSLYEENSSSDESTPLKKQYETRQHNYHSGSNWVEDEFSSDSTSSMSGNVSSGKSYNGVQGSGELGDRGEMSGLGKVKTSRKRTHDEWKQAKNMAYYKDNTWYPGGNMKKHKKKKSKKLKKRHKR